MTMNGTPTEMLLDGYMEAINALDVAIAKVRATMPNARDYVDDPSFFPSAFSQHRAQVEHLLRIQFEVQSMAEHLA